MNIQWARGAQRATGMPATERRLRSARLDRKRLEQVIAAIALTILGVGTAFGQDATLPGGASSLSETFQDWQVICEIVEQAPVCAVSQVHRDSASQQIVFAADLMPAPQGTLEGRFILPFGLQLSEGVSVSIDEAAASEPLPYSTCLPVGCVVPVSFDANRVMGLKIGTALKLAVMTANAGEALELPISLMGFSAAIDRARGLAGPE